VALVAREVCCGGFCVVAVVFISLSMHRPIVHLWSFLSKEKSGSLPKKRCIILELDRKFKLKLPVCANIYTLFIFFEGYTLFILIIQVSFVFFNHIAFAWYLNSKFRTDEEVCAPTAHGRVHARDHWRIEVVVFIAGLRRRAIDKIKPHPGR